MAAIVHPSDSLIASFTHLLTNMKLVNITPLNLDGLNFIWLDSTVRVCS